MSDCDDQSFLYLCLFVNVSSRTSLEDIEDEDEIDEYESEDNTDIEKKVTRPIFPPRPFLLVPVKNGPCKRTFNGLFSLCLDAICRVQFE